MDNLVIKVAKDDEMLLRTALKAKTIDIGVHGYGISLFIDCIANTPFDFVLDCIAQVQAFSFLSENGALLHIYDTRLSFEELLEKFKEMGHSVEILKLNSIGELDAQA